MIDLASGLIRVNIEESVESTTLLRGLMEATKKVVFSGPARGGGGGKGLATMNSSPQKMWLLSSRGWRPGVRP